MFLHTHPFNGPFSGTTWVSRYQKGKTNLDLTEARDSEWQWHQLGHMQVSRHITTPAPHHSVFYRPDALPATQPTASKHWRQWHQHIFEMKSCNQIKVMWMMVRISFAGHGICKCVNNIVCVEVTQLLVFSLKQCQQTQLSLKHNAP